MKKTTLEKIHIHHFAGIEDEIIEFNPAENWRNLPNGQGKTTVADAFCWVILGKDSLGNTRFNFEPTNIENPQPKVTVWLDVDGEKIILAKEVGKWNYNGLEVKKTVFEDFLSNIYNIETLELLSNPMAFMNLHWETRRNYFTGLFCEKVDEKSEFSFLMKSMSISDIRKSKTQQKKVASDGLKRCATILEVHEKSKQELSEIDFSGLKTQLDQKKSELEKAANFDWKKFFAAESSFNVSKRDYASLVSRYKEKEVEIENSQKETLETSKGCVTCGTKISQAKFDELKKSRVHLLKTQLENLKNEIIEKRTSNDVVKKNLEALEKTKPDETTAAVIAEIQKGIDFLNIQIAKENDILELNKKIEAEQKQLDAFTAEIMQIEAFMDRFKDFLASYYTSINNNFDGLYFDIEDECKLTNAKGTEFKRFSMSEKINAGIQIISVLSEKIGLAFPLFVDNRESVTKLFPIETQVINLKVKDDGVNVVLEGDKLLESIVNQ